MGSIVPSETVPRTCCDLLVAALYGDRRSVLCEPLHSPPPGFAEYVKQMREMMGAGETPEQRQSRRDADRANAMLTQAAENQRKDRAEQMARINAAASLYGADQTRYQTQAYREADDRRQERQLAETMRHNQASEAIARLPKPPAAKDPQAARNARSKLEIELRKLATDEAKEAGIYDPAAIDRRYNELMIQHGLITPDPNAPQPLPLLPDGTIDRDALDPNRPYRLNDLIVTWDGKDLIPGAQTPGPGTQPGA